MMNSLKPAEKRLLQILLLVIVLLAVALPRLLELDRYVTPDETKWLMRSGNFYMALAQDDLAATFQKEHPGVTITWAGLAGFLRRYPSYIAVRPGQIERAEKLLIFLRNQKVSAIDLLVAGRKFVAGQIYGEIPPGEKGRFDEITDAAEPSGEAATLAKADKKKV